MEKGKRICQALRELRKRIADANNIPFEMEECTHEGDCPGTCPKCESEVRYLMDSIVQLELKGTPVVIDGIMSEDELCKAFSITSAEQDLSEKPEDMETMGQPEPPEPMTLMGDTEPPLAGVPVPFSSYGFASVIAKEIMSKKDGNFVFSPAGLCSILEILQQGMDAHSKIYNQIDELIWGFNSEMKSIDDERFMLANAIGIWHDEKLGAIKEDFLDYIKDVYEAEVHNADFAQKTKTKLRIDKWVSEKTHNMIKSLDTELSADALILVLDAIYMNAKWENPFDPCNTETDIFHNADGTESEVDMMFQNYDDAEYSETDEYQVITLPYKRYDNYMVVVLPKEGIDIENIMSKSDWLDEANMQREVELFMPRFKFDNTLSYKDILMELGIGDIFEKEDSFPCISDLPVHISQIKQQCVITVEEEGTEAAAVTIAECCMGGMPPDDIPQPVTMKIDRPFGFAIRSEYNQLLFMGVVKDMNKTLQ